MRFGGEIYDRTGSYDEMFVTFSVICMIATVLLVACRQIGRRQAREKSVVAAAARLRTHCGSQKMTVAAMQMADMNVWAQRS
jgi:nitrate/nitrite transporter NarK